MNQNKQAENFENWLMTVSILKENNQIKVYYRYNYKDGQEITRLSFIQFINAFKVLQASKQQGFIYKNLNFVKETAKDSDDFEDLMIHTLPQGTVYESSPLEKVQINSLFSQIQRFFKDELFICIYNFEYIIKFNNEYHFLILPGLIKFDDATDRQLNLSDKVKHLSRAQLIYKGTNKKLEVLSFLKHIFIKQDKKFFDYVLYNLFQEDEIKMVMRENIYLEDLQRFQGYLSFNLIIAYNKDRIEDYKNLFKEMKQIEKESKSIKFDFIQDFENAYELISGIQQSLIVERVKTIQFAKQNRNSELVEQLDKQIEKSIEQYYNQPFDQIDGNLKEVTQILDKRIDHQKNTYNNSNDNTLTSLYQYKQEIISNLEQYKKEILQIRQNNNQQ